LTVTFFVLVTLYWATRRRAVYLLDFHTYQPPDELKCTTEYYKLQSRRVGCFDEESMQFQEKLLERTGLGEETYFPRGIMAEKVDTSLEVSF
jgi:3-ketoacyl-CoA synthase